MKIYGNKIKCFAFVLFLMLFQQAAAQINVQVNILPPYQSHISEYASRPGLILLTLTNTSNQTQNVQLRGHIAGDNGVVISLKDGFQSPRPIEIAPMQTRTLNGSDLIDLFNYANLDMVGITERDFVSGTGLPEGNYDFCIQAFDYDEPMVALSPEEPLGCTMLSITSLDPPTIIAPFNKQALQNVGVQSFPITWSTPPGAPPNLEYHVRMVEVFADQNPNEAILNTRSFFERTAYNNTMLYGPADPALTPGRTYAMVVEASDPFGKVAIRNHGRSEVVVFTYGSDEPAVASTTNQTGTRENPEIGKNAKTFTTNLITGILKGTFSSSEELLGASTPGEANTATTRVDYQTFKPDLTTAIGMVTNNINTNMISPLLAMKADPTVATSYNPVQSGAENTGDNALSMQQGPAMSVQGQMSSMYATTSGTAEVAFQKVQSALANYNKPFPLAGATVHLQAVASGNAQIWGRERSNNIQIATGKTEADGSFSLEMTDPKYAQLPPIDKLLLTVHLEDFEPYVYEIPVAVLDKQEVLDIGDHTLSAKIYRFAPRLALEAAEGIQIDEDGVELVVFRPAEEVAKKSYLSYEGNLTASNRISKVIDGRDMIAVARVTTRLRLDGSPLMPRLFYSGKQMVEIVPASPRIKGRHTVLAVDRVEMPEDEILVFSPTYKLQLENPAVSGRVVLKGGEQFSGVSNAYVQVTYDREDVDGFLDIPDLPRLSNPTIELPSGGVVYTTTQPTGGIVYTTTPSSSQGSSVGGYTTAVNQAAGAYALPLQIDAQGQVNVTAVEAASDWMNGIDWDDVANTVYENSPFTAKTDSTGYFYIGGLPALKEGAQYTISLVRVPSEYQKMPVAPETRSHLFAIGRGTTQDMDFEILPEVVTVAGIVRDEANQPVPNARLNFKGGGTIFESNAQGRFEIEYFNGEHILEVNKSGYVTLEQPVTIAEGHDDVGDVGPLEKLRGKIKFIVRDIADTGNLLSDVQIALFDTTHTTNQQGEWQYEGFGGEALVTITPPGSSGFVAAQYTVDIASTGEVTEVFVDLQRGVRVYGTVSSSNQVVADAEISVDSKPYLSTQTDADGKYSLYVPTGEDIIQAAKIGYYSESQHQEFLAGSDEQLDFVLKDGEGKNISTLLGFEIQLEESKDDPDQAGGAIWKGKFVNLEANPTLFEGTRKASLPFEDLKVQFDAQGNAIPENGEVITSKKTLPLKLFDYLPLTLEGDEYIVVRRNPNQKGSISGRLRINGTAFLQSNLGLRFAGLKDIYVTPHADTEMIDVEVFHEDAQGGLPELTLNLVGLSDSTVASLDLYGFNFTLDLNASNVSQAGFTLRGNIATPSLGIISAAEIEVEALSINSSFELNSLLINESDLPTLSLNNWSIELGSIAFNEDGFELSGGLKVDPGMLPAGLAVTFEDLKLAKDALYGGKFHLPEAGLNMFGLASLKPTENKHLSLARVGNTDVYSLTGAGEFMFQKLFTKSIRINSFHLQTDGAFDLDIPVDFKADLGFADLKITGINVGNPDVGNPYIAVLGQFKTDISMLSFESSNIRFESNRSGEVSFSVDSISASLNTPVFNTGLALHIVDDEDKRGFGGGGILKIPSTPLEAELSFHLYKLRAGGLDLGAKFASGAYIPISPVVSIVELAGGFSYNSNTEKFSVNIGGAVSLTGFDRLLKLDNIDLGVTASNAGVVIKGEVDLVAVDVTTLASAEIKLDLPNKYFAVTVETDISLPKKIGSVSLDGMLKVQWKDDLYAFFGTSTALEVFGGAFKADGKFVLAYNLQGTKNNTDAKIKSYFSNMEGEIAQNHGSDTFSGLYLDVKQTANARVGFDSGILSASAYFSSTNKLFVYANLQQNDYKASFSTDTKAGLDVGFLWGLGSVGIDGFFKGRLAASYLNSNWGFEGRIAGGFEAGLGSNWRRLRCNSIGYTEVWFVSVPTSVKGCLAGYLDVSYKNSKLDIDAGLGKK